MADKVDVKQLLDGPDEFITFSDKLVKWGQENLKLVIAGCVAFVLIVCAIVGVRAYIDYRNDEAATTISPAYRSYMEIVAGQAPEDQLPKTVEAMEQAISEYRATSAGIMGSIALGHLFLEKGDWQKAETLFAGLTEESDLTPDLVPLAWHGLGKAREGLKKYAEAAEAYADAARLGGAGLKSLFTYDQARALNLAGNKEQAASLYRRLIKDYPDDPMVGLAKAALVNLDLDPAS
jgi:predicted negative regulator of RcsB-dependent stress response